VLVLQKNETCQLLMKISLSEAPTDRPEASYLIHVDISCLHQISVASVFPARLGVEE
jgi:hypothetical protein